MPTTRPFDPIEYWRVAQSLAQNTTNQARLRAAIGRAYYAMFLIAREKTGIRDRRDVHEKVINALEARHEHAVATALGQLRRLRELAEYQLTPAVEGRDWRANWQQAQRMVTLMRPRLEAMHVTRPPRQLSEE